MESSASGGRRIVGVEMQGDVLGRAKDGDERAFLALFRAAQPGLLRYLAVMVGEAAEEVAAQTWSEIGRDLPDFSGSLDDFRSWVASVGRRLALDHLDAVRAVDQLPRQLAADRAAFAAAPPATAAALRLVATLPPEQAEAILMRSVLGLDETVSGTLLGIRRSALRRAARRGLRALGRRLESVTGAAAGPTSGTASGTASRAASGGPFAPAQPSSASPVAAAAAPGPVRPLRVVTLPDDVQAHAVGQNTPLPSFDRHRRRPERSGPALTPTRGLEVSS